MKHLIFDFADAVSAKPRDPVTQREFQVAAMTWLKHAPQRLQQKKKLFPATERL